MPNSAVDRYRRRSDRSFDAKNPIDVLSFPVNATDTDRSVPSGTGVRTSMFSTYRKKV